MYEHVSLDLHVLFICCYRYAHDYCDMNKCERTYMIEHQSLTNGKHLTPIH